MEKTFVTIDKIKQELLNLKYDNSINSVKFIGGISNENFLINNKVVLRIPYFKDSNCSIFPFEMENIAFKNNLGPKLINYSLKTNSKITEYLDGYENICFNNINDLNLEKIISAVKVIHNFNPTGYRELDYFKDINLWLKESKDNEISLKSKIVQDFLRDFSVIYDILSKELSHADMLESNILIKGNDIKIIDFEYSAYTFKYFDLMSLLSENNISKDQQKKIIDIYFKDNITEKETFLQLEKSLHKALDLYWYSWAISRKCGLEAKDKIFEEIANLKKQSFLNL